MERVAGIEPASQAWKASALPLSYTRPQAQRPATITRHPSTPKRGIHYALRSANQAARMMLLTLVHSTPQHPLTSLGPQLRDR